MDFTGSRVTPLVEEPLSETRVPGTGSARAPCSPAPELQGWRGARLPTPAERAAVQGKGRLPALAGSCCFLSCTEVAEEGRGRDRDYPKGQTPGCTSRIKTAPLWWWEPGVGNFLKTPHPGSHTRKSVQQAAREEAAWAPTSCCPYGLHPAA